MPKKRPDEDTIYAGSAQNAVVMAAFSKFAALSLLETVESEPDNPIWHDAAVITNLTKNGEGVILDLKGVLQESVDRNQKRLDHAVKCLKRKGLYAKDFQEMALVCEKLGLNETLTGIRLVQDCLGGIYHNQAEEEQFSLESWEAAIEMAMFATEKKRMMTTELYGPLLYPNITVIYMFTIMTSYAKDLTAMLRQHIQRIDTLDGLAQSMGGFEQAFATIYQIINQKDMDIGTVREEARRQMDLQKDAYERYRDDAEQELHKARKSLLPLIAENEALKEQLSEEKDRGQQLSGRIRELEAALEQKDRQISELALQIQQEELPELPAEGVVFVGGHINMVKKLVQTHPGWKFIDGGDKNFPPFSGCRCLFFWDKHLSHPTYHKAQAMRSSDTPVVYLKSTNPDQLEQEMRRGYWACFHQESEETADA